MAFSQVPSWWASFVSYYQYSRLSRWCIAHWSLFLTTSVSAHGDVSILEGQSVHLWQPKHNINTLKDLEPLVSIWLDTTRNKNLEKYNILQVFGVKHTFFSSLSCFSRLKSISVHFDTNCSSIHLQMNQNPYFLTGPWEACAFTKRSAGKGLFDRNMSAWLQVIPNQRCVIIAQVLFGASNSLYINITRCIRGTEENLGETTSHPSSTPDNLLVVVLI